MPDTNLRHDRIYLVTSEQDSTVDLALNPSYDDGYMQWFDTLRPRMKEGKLIQAGPTSAEFESADGARYKFTVLTLDFFNQNIRDSIEGNPSINSEDELHRFYVETFGDS